jgi:prevent-host-death family protein
MVRVSLTEAKDRLSALVDEAESTHEIVEITRHGHPAAVLMSADDLESMRETIHWLSQPGFLDSLTESRQDAAAGRTIGAAELRAKYGLPPR